jgi:hypothetical protein
MNLLIKLVESPWFWLDVILSVWGGILVWRGLRIEKNAEKLLPPENFKPDIFADVVEKYRSEMERGWRILMRGIIIEVVAALGISIISGLEIAELNDKAERAEKDAARANERAAVIESKNAILFSIGERAKESASQANEAAEKSKSDRLSIEKQVEEFKQTNLVLQATVLKLEAKNQDRTIRGDQIINFITSLGGSVKGKPIWFGTRHPNRETRDYFEQVANLLAYVGIIFESRINYNDDLTEFDSGSSIAILIDTASNAPPYATSLYNAFNIAGMNPTLVTNQPNRFYLPTEAHPGSNQVVVLIGERP